MAPILEIRQATTPPPPPKQVPRDVIAYISAGGAVLLVLLGITLGWLVRKCRRRRRIRERRKTRHAQREKLHASDPNGGYQRSYSMRTTTSNGSFATQDYKRPSPDERWKWNPPSEPGVRNPIQIPPNAKFF